MSSTESSQVIAHNTNQIDQIKTALSQHIDGEAAVPLVEFKAMLSGNERGLLYNAGKHFYKGEGCIVDGGCFIGGSTFCLGKGLEANTNLKDEQKKKAIKSYDMFKIWTYAAKPYMPEGYEIGDNFRPVFDENIKDIKDFVEVHAGDLMEQPSLDEPIEILFLDICKSWELERQTRKLFFKALKPGSVIIQQDFYTTEAPWNAMIPYVLRDYITYVSGIDSTAIFVVEKEIPDELCDYDLEDNNFDEMTKILNEAISLYGQNDPTPLILSAGHLIYKFQGPRPAFSYLLSIEKKYNLGHQNDHMLRALENLGHWDRHKRVF